MPAAAMKNAPKKKLPPPRVVAEDDEQESSGSSLPLISVLDQGTMDAAKQMLLEAQEIRGRMDTDAERLDEIKQSLVGIADAFGLAGLRYGTIGLEYHGMKTKRTLDKALLLEYGVKAQTIAASYSESKPFVSSRFVNIRR